MNLEGSKIADIGPLKDLINLWDLNLEGNLITYLTALKNLDKLKYLNIKGCHKINDEQVAELQKALPKLSIGR